MALNPVAYYKLDGNSNDYVGGNNGTDTSVTYSNTYGIINNGAGSTVGTTRIYLGNPTAFQISGAQFINFWIVGTAQGAVNRSIFASGGINGVTDGGIYMFHYSGQTIDFGVSNGSSLSNVTLNTTQTAALLNGTKHMVTCVFNPSTKVEVFVDKVSVVSTTTSVISSRLTTKNWSLFAIETDQSATRRDAVICGIDEFGVYPGIPTSGDLDILYNAGAGKQPPFTVTTGNFFRMF